MSDFDPRIFRPGNRSFGKPVEQEEPAPSEDHATNQERRGKVPGNWWGSAAFSAVDPHDAQRRVLIDALRPGEDLDQKGERLPDTVLLKRARIRTHPDHRGGDRTAWDRVERAARLMGLLSD